MKKLSSLIVKGRYFLLAVFVLSVVASCFMMQHVNINYNLMQYLDKNSSSTEALEVMENEFGSVGQCQAMVSEVKSAEQVAKIKAKLEKVDGVASVIEYYHQDTGKALYKVFLTTGNFDTASYNTLDQIREALSGYEFSLNGGSVESEFLTNSLERDMVIIIAIVVAVVFLILMLTSSSFIEPVLFLLIAGGAILINMGTNLLLNAIPYIGNAMSFITKSIAAVMQLALSMDYAIVLLHAYKEAKESYSDKKEAMMVALQKAFAPVSASSITTIAGLVALMFMSFSIGFDVGLVLAKGILISLLCVFLFMPGMLLLCDKLLVKTAHRPIDRIILAKMKAHDDKRKAAGKKVYTMAGFQNKTKIIVPILAAIIFVVGAVYDFNSDYSFTLQASTDANSTINVDDEKITDEFGTQNTLVVLIDKDGKNRNKFKAEEQAIVEYLNNYEYNGKKVINSTQGYSTYGVYNDLTAEQFANAYLDQDSKNANIRGVKVLYTYMGATDQAKNVYDVIKYAAENQGADKITQASQKLIDQAYQAYTVPLTAEQFAYANQMDLTTVQGIYTYMGKGAAGDTATTYEVLKFVVEHNMTSDVAIKTKYAELSAELTKKDAKLNYGVDDATLNLIYGANEKVSSQTLITVLSTKQYYVQSAYQKAMQAQFDTNYQALGNFESENYIRVIFNFDMPSSGEDSFKAINEISDYLYGEYDNTKLVSETFVYSQIKNVFNQDIVTVNIISFVAILLIIAITFKSVFTPALLTLLIQGAIWVTMGISTMTGNEIFFICYMVVMCVQMGATIDYGILLTNNYINNRKQQDMKTAMSQAMSSSISTILTSGSILVLATLIIGLVSKVSIVADLGLLLSRGCLISILMILGVLPQCLMICDQVIEKTSIKTKFYHEEKAQQ